MDEARYIISEASKRIGVKTHVLRYWEEELSLKVKRNEMDHRYYKDEDIELLKVIKHLKEQGFQLKAIKMLLPDIHNLDSLDANEVNKLKEELNRKEAYMSERKDYTELNEGTSLIADNKDHNVNVDDNDKMVQFKRLMSNIIKDAIKDNNNQISSEISENVVDGVSKEMQYLMRLQEKKSEERDQRLLDLAIRETQRSRYQAAATYNKRRKKSKFFKKNNVHI